jgi:hypothetical protein
MKLLFSKKEPLTGEDTYRHEWSLRFLILVYSAIGFLTGAIVEKFWPIGSSTKSLLLLLVLGFVFMLLANIKLMKDLSNLEGRSTFDKKHSKALSNLVGAKIANGYGESHWDVTGGIEIVGSGSNHVRVRGFGQDSLSDVHGEGFSMDISIALLAKYCACGIEALKLELQRKANERYNEKNNQGKGVTEFTGNATLGVSKDASI